MKRNKERRELKKVYLTSITATLGPCKTSKSSPDTKEMEEQFAIAPLFLFS
jgi:hypothetical protein